MWQMWKTALIRGALNSSWGAAGVAGADATLKEISQMSQISCQSLNGANSGSRGPREEVKKGKSSKSNHPNDEQVKSSATLKVWSHEGSNLHPKMAKNGSMGLKQRCYTGLQKNFQAETKVFLGSRRDNWAETIDK